MCAGALLRRLLLGVGGVAAFAAGSFGSFLLFQWPDLLRTVVVTLLMAALALMIARSLLAILFEPWSAQVPSDRADFRLLPMSKEAARHFRSRLALAIGWFAFGSAFVQILRTLEVDASVVHLIAYALGLGLLAIGLDTIWRSPADTLEQPLSEGTTRDRMVVHSWLWSAGFTALWLMWVAGAMRLFWLVIIALALPLVIAWSRKAVHHLFAVEPTPEGEVTATNLVSVTIERVVRAALILASIWALTWAWGVGFQNLADSDTAITKVARSLLTVLIILLVADLAWQLTKTLIDALLVERPNPLIPVRKRPSGAPRCAPCCPSSAMSG